ncbi:hypothetical protein [Bradyrhizobium sp. McL0615]|uniref:hypothetical protein n=1 Tax=Bradyrhizobium sp. McL0615 TaxID=3415673 RepID=UPI003CF1CCD3
MAIDALRSAVETAWTIDRATHDGVDAADGRRCLLERHLSGRPEARGGAVEVLAHFGCAASGRRMLTPAKELLGWLALGSARPVWTVLAVSHLVSAAVVLVLRSAFGAGG